MPETPDFEQLARQIFAVWSEHFRHNSEATRNLEVSITDAADQLRQVWNARGVADLAIVNTALAAHLGEIGYSTSALDAAVMLAIQSMDR